MRAQGPTFWLLNGDLSWRTGATENISTSKDPKTNQDVVKGDIRLAVDPNGPLALTGEDGSLGGLTLPQGMALDASHLTHLLDLPNNRIKRFEPEAKAFLPLPAVGEEGSHPRQFRDPRAIAIAGGDLYVADTGNRRIQVFALSTLALRYVWGPWDDEGQPVDVSDPSAWEPVDLAAVEDRVVILDRHYGQVLLHRPGSDALKVLIKASPDNAGRFSRIALDRECRVYLLDSAAPSLAVYRADGKYLEQVSDPGEVIDRFPAPPIRLDHKERFCLAQTLARDCARALPSPPPSPQSPLAGCGPDGGGLLFDRYGNALEFPADPEPAGPRLYARKGTWISTALDSEIYACQWHRIELELAQLPAGSKLVVSTYADHEPRSMEDITNPALLPERLWETKQVVLGRAPSEPDDEDATTLVCDEEPAAQYEEMLVQSHPGQYLWLRLELHSDGYATPEVEAVRVHDPRDSYLKYLPAVYAADDESRWFLERFLSMFQTEWDALEARIEDIARYFDPDAVPAGPCLDYLASQWLALPLEGAWDFEQKRRLVAAAPELYERRGTPEGLRLHLRVYLANLTGIDELLGDDDSAPEGPQAFPLMVEGFRKRAFLMLTERERACSDERPPLARLGRNHPLWSPAVVGRLQLDVFAHEGEIRLVSTGDPERDLFHEHAHRFQVFVPSAWVKTRADEDLLRRALDTEKPAHARYQLCLVEPRFRVGIQSTVGVDTVLGAYPVAVLAGRDRSEVPENRPPRQRLGYDTVLGCGPGWRGGMPLRPGARVGTNTVLT